MVIKLTTNTPTNDTNVRYRDFHFDIEEGNISGYTNLNIPVNRSDIKSDINLAAIKNSIFNIFNTIPGQKVLNPEFGLDLRQFLFEPVSDYMGKVLGDRILQGIRRWEPRVVVTRVGVGVNIDEQQYTISLSMSVPTLNNITMKVGGSLSKSGIQII